MRRFSIMGLAICAAFALSPAGIAISAEPAAKAPNATAGGPTPPASVLQGQSVPIQGQIQVSGQVTVGAQPEAPAEKKPVRKSAPKKAPVPDPHWEYEGLHGPENWGKLKAEYRLCSDGKQQSPIDIQGGTPLDLPPIRFSYLPASFSVVDNGHTIQLTLNGAGSIEVDGVRYEFVQMHFHHPAEEKIDGKSFEMVAHLVHRSASGALAVVAVLMTQGSENPVFAPIWGRMPLKRDVPVSSSGATLDLSLVLPRNKAYFKYLGSLTTPPCSENVLWLVMKRPVELSAGQIAAFRQRYANNARPIQRRNERWIQETQQ